VRSNLLALPLPVASLEVALKATLYPRLRVLLVILCPFHDDLTAESLFKVVYEVADKDRFASA
jgi:hypothetical protein